MFNPSWGADTQRTEGRLPLTFFGNMKNHKEGKLGVQNYIVVMNENCVNVSGGRGWHPRASKDSYTFFPSSR